MNNLPIFITGFQRSGTTLVRRIVSMHPGLKYEVLHEQRRLYKYKSPSDAFKNYNVKVKQEGKFTGAVASIQSGEKIPYFGHFGNLDSIKSDIIRFKEYWPDSTIIHVERDIEGLIGSNKRKFNVDPSETKEYAEEDVPEMKDFISCFSNVVWLNYDKIISMPYNTVNTLYSLMGGFKEDSVYVGKVCNTRDPWEYNGRIMCGLRYGNKIERLHTYE